MTLKSRILRYAEVDDLAAFGSGDLVVLTWSGAFGRTSGLRSVKTDSAPDAGAELTMPAEFVSTEHDDRYVIFRLPISADAIEAIASLEPGEWVTMASPHEPGDPDEVLIEARPYAS